MGWINATRIITMMAYTQTVWNGTIVQFIADTMRLAHCASGEANASVAIVVKCALPFPALIRAAFIHLRPKAFGQRAFRVRSMAFYVLTLISVFVGARSGRTTAASAEYGIIEGHQNLQFCCHSPGRLPSPLGYFYWLHRCNYSTERSNEERRT